MSPDLQDVDYVGPARAESLEAIGIDSVSKLAEAQIGLLTDEIGTVGSNMATEMIASASELHEDEAEDDLDEAEDETPAKSTVVFDVPVELYPHFVDAVSDHLVALKAANDFVGVERIERMLEVLATEYPSKTEGRVPVSLTVDMDDLVELQRAVSSKRTEYKGRPGITSLGGDMERILGQIGDARDEHWGE